MINFLAGMALCDLNIILKYKVPEHICIGITIVGLWTAAVHSDLNSWLSRIGFHTGEPYPNLMLGAILVVTGVAFSPYLKKLLSNGFLVWMKKLFFSVYVIHMIIIGSYSCIAFSLLNQIVSYNIAAMVTIASSIILVYFVSTYFCRWFDLGGQKFSKALYETSYNQVSLMVKKVYKVIVAQI